ncbi:alpha-1,3-mannosyl-glycoprotein 4-beta-N-acetylglucosaminyltransferase C-like [Epinephelus fuscoguttatus]|uniref:alpha-1,3-mannosyl-glycoprotein 4-beta-N-acetylglucosaminyltransferase C-like n=1 Tax=Epinephelus fuscoguttatus TaxID=293821 RepID=UPI0020D0F38A|nr:alpha-1,3-mannosyl-glycoprotein 4-beta-N-acetylglucosaminyltransferase C-like [Epinephelus fuscoguttatus]XP_049430646.1 alpha-1,3-mannosyl-glycoprotein 4-beta-N-acetylglucosaminyltransferase C-like [Epinephelus fuscoguttatus]XP_049430647.1 alpha-1,3-mannosyl-glycoprotein 4-beta-N-acetylglucosaminyltransferase C-like [Epinephelus fuscoguttatus]XP_049430648.1 alpha-1,3-mannosyl-glycoprotein 4-beta-N-acetylglucosaminyltransferase C-like [Epinephelus fuscoguttatus]
MCLKAPDKAMILWLMWKSVDKMRCFRKRSMLPFLGFLIIFLLFFNLYMDDGYVLEAEKRQLGETLMHPVNSERYVHTFRDLSNFSGTINVTYRYLAGIPLPRKKYLTIGLSSVKRKKGNYLLETIKSIFDQSSYEELKEIVVVVHLADFDLVWCENLVQEITRKFAHHIIAGRLLVIQAPEEYYPSLVGLKRNYNDPEDRVRFRSKQNVDYAFLLNFCTNLSHFYMMLEDDVRCSRNFLTALKKVITSREGSYWVMLEFSKLGYIGKLYHSRDLPRLAHFLLMFYQEMPCDWLLIHFRGLLAQKDVIRFKPSLFQHMGYYSSYKGAENKLKDDDFEEDSIDIPDNPPASLYTNINVFENYDATKAYSTVDEYFWGKPPCTGDFFVIIFNKSTKISRIKIVTGTEDRQNDILHHGALEVGQKSVDTKQGRQCTSYITLGEFKGGSIEVNNVDHKIGFDIECVRVVVTASQKEWLIIRTISLWTTQPVSQFIK